MKIRNLLTLSTLVACGLTLASCGDTPASSSSKSESTSTSTSTTSESTSSVVETKKNVNVGMGYDVSLAESGQADIVAAMVAFNEKTGVIEGARIDVVQVKVESNETHDGLQLTSKCATREDYKVKTKLELGKDYNMVTYGGAVQEVDGQIEDFAAWTVGKTAEQVANSLTARTGAHYEGNVYTNDDTLWASVTITVNKLVAAVVKAYENKSVAAYEWVDGAKVGVGINAGVAYNYGKPSKEVSADLAGAVVANGKVVAAAIDAVVVSYNVAAEDGAISYNTTTKYHTGSTESDIKVISKRDLGDAYAMRVASPIQKEWNEQAVAFEGAVVGHTAEELATVDYATAGCTITNTSYVSALANAVNYAGLEHIGPQAEAAK